MSIEKITSKIIDDARAEAEKVLAEAGSTAAEIAAEAEKQAADIIAEAEKKGAADREKQLLSRRAVAVIDGRNIALGYKQDIIRQCFDEAVTKVISMDRAEYLDFLTKLAQSSGSGGGEVVLSDEDAAELGAELIDRLNAGQNDSASGGQNADAGQSYAGSTGQNGSFRLSEEKRNIRGGLMIKQGNTWYNASIEAIVEEIRNDLTAEVASVLFDGQENENGSKK